MKQKQIEALIILTEELMKFYSAVLDENDPSINGELRVKMAQTESSLFKIAKLLKGIKQSEV